MWKWIRKEILTYTPVKEYPSVDSKTFYNEIERLEARIKKLEKK